MFMRVLAGLILVASSMVAKAEIGTIDQVPAATLLFPHFEVNTQSSQGVNTLITVQNTSATAILQSVTLWTDYGVPTLHYNFYLTGYDQQTIDLGELFRQHFIPDTASAGQDPQDIISNQGAFSQDINFASCNGVIPEPTSSLASGSDLIAAHTGGPSNEFFGGLCGGRNYGDAIARGYVTVDTVNSCQSTKPGDPGYFGNGGSGTATNQNVLAGDYLIVDRTRSRFFSESAVHIEASYSNPLVTVPGNITFYGRLLGYNATDNREPLPTAWAGRIASGRTDVDYWRDPGVIVAPFTCGTTPAPYALGQTHLTVFDETGAVSSNPTGSLLPYATGSASGVSLSLTPSLGWLFANLNVPVASGPTGVIRQSWLSFRQVPRSVPTNATMGYAVPGIQLGNAAYGDSPIIP